MGSECLSGLFLHRGAWGFQKLFPSTNRKSHQHRHYSWFDFSGDDGATPHVEEAARSGHSLKHNCDMSRLAWPTLLTRK
jgi:hypothetical protein